MDLNTIIVEDFYRIMDLYWKNVALLTDGCIWIPDQVEYLPDKNSFNEGWYLCWPVSWWWDRTIASIYQLLWRLLRRSQRLRIQLLPPLHAVRRTKCKTLSDTVALLHIRTHFKQKLSIFLGHFTFVWRVHCRRVWCSGELATICIAHNHRAGQQGDNLRYLRSAHIIITHIYRVSLALASLSSLGRWCSLVGWYSDSEEKAL